VVDQKPILASFMGAGKVAAGIKILHQGRIPQYDSPDRAVATAKAMVDYVRWRKRPKRRVQLFPVNRRKVEKTINQYLRRGQKTISEIDSRGILEAYGFVTPKTAVANTPEQAAGLADQFGYPVVIKIWSPHIIHKTDVGGVMLGLNSNQEVKDAFDLMMYRIPKKMPEAHILGVEVQEMCIQGQEVILGMNRDLHFGPLMMFGMGGIMVEVLKDVSFYLAPLTADEAREMLVNTQTFRILKGYRGKEGVDTDAIAESLQRLSQLATEFPQIQEVDINPYLVGPSGITPVAVNSRILVEKIPVK
jgi:acetyltransferase